MVFSIYTSQHPGLGDSSFNISGIIADTIPGKMRFICVRLQLVKVDLSAASALNVFFVVFACGALVASICVGIVIPSTWLSIYITYC